MGILCFSTEQADLSCTRRGKFSGGGRKGSGWECHWGQNTLAAWCPARSGVLVLGVKISDNTVVPPAILHEPEGDSAVIKESPLARGTRMPD